MSKYSIITPMYNSFDLMDRYFLSLSNQTLKDFEIILIDDCSEDGSFEKACDYISKSDMNISIYKTEKNSGPGNARNLGIKKATGEWITFVDNDDWVDDDLLEKIDKVIESEDVNCVIFDYYMTDGNKNEKARSMYCGNTGRQSVSDCMIYARNHTVGKFYKRVKCIENDIYFPNLRRCEDVAFVCQAISACSPIYYLHESKYYYYQRPNSLSNNNKLDETDMIKAFHILENALGETYSQELKEKSVPDLLYGVLLMMCKSSKSNKEIKAYIDDYNSKYPMWEKCEIIKHLGIAKKVFLKATQYRMVFVLKILTYLHTRLIG